MISINQKISQINSKFNEHSIKVDYEWLSGCVQWFIEDEPTISLEQLFEQANEQWQLSNLSDSGIPCLPESIFEDKGIQTIHGKFPLQMQYILDISEPAYDQLQRLYNQQIDEPKEQPEYRQNQNASKKKRVIKMVLTDGPKTVEALEYSPIACLTSKLSPGVKMLLTGPMRCINHILFLESKNIRILGGEVEMLQILNAYENVLLRALNRPLNPKPITDYNENVIRENGVRSSGDSQLPSIPMQSVSSARSVNAIVDHFNDDDLFLDIDIDELAATAVIQPTERVDSVAIQNQTDEAILLDDHDSSDLLLGEIDMLDNIDVNLGERNTSAVNMDMSIRMDDVQIVNNSSVQSNIATIADEDYAFKIRSINLVTIKQLRDCSDDDKRKREFFIVKAEIDAIIKNVHVSRHGWSLGVLLSDGNSSDLLQVKFSSTVLEKLSNVSPQEMYEMNERRRSHPQAGEDISQILKELSSRLENLHCYMKIQYLAGSELPVVIELIEPAPVLERKLKEKLEKEQ